MQKIGAWIRDPANNLFKGMTKRAGLYELFCDKPETCDLLAIEGSCLHCGALTRCRFGRKVETEGPTRQARSFGKTMKAWRDRNEGFLGKLESLRAYNRIFRTHGHYYLPYSFMAKDSGLFGGSDSYPLDSKWVPEEDLTTELLDRICTARPRAMFGDVITDYQAKQVPKFLADLKAFYPEVFDRLPDEQKARLASISYVGRKADITTCAPGEYVITKNKWTWDGSVLTGKSMLFQPVAGEIEIRITPKPGESVEITDNSQVTAGTRFLD